ncbi:MAG: CHAT domain-containing protein [Cytophagaceae bacterium]|jgi:CHAT domain-containing protein|nr:CHAT domain-containing protein [Cytophagaceae bacterium]
MKTLYLIFVFVWSIGNAFAKLSEADILQLHKYYRTANYKAGLILIKDQIRNAERSKDSSRSQQLLLLYAFKASFAKQLSKEQDYLTSLSKAKENFTIQQANDLNAYAYQAFIQALLADERVKEALEWKSKWASIRFEKKALDIVQLSNATLEFANGDYLALQQHLPDYIKQAQASIMLKDSVQVRSKMKLVKLPAYDVRARRARYSELVQLRAAAFAKNGYYDSCISILTEHERWVKKNLHFQEGALANIYFLMALSFEQLDNRDRTLDFARKASGASLKYYLQHAPIRIEIQELLINSLLADEKFTEAEVYNNDLDVKVLGYYGKSGFWYKRNNYIDIEHLLMNHAWKRAESELSDFSKVKSTYPLTHAFRLKSDLDLCRILLKNNKLTEAEKVLDSLLVLASTKFGEESPRYQLIQLEKAHYLATYTEQLKQAVDLFESSITSLRKSFAPCHPELVNFLNHEAELYLEIEEYEKAETAWNALIQELTKYPGDSSLPYAITLSHQIGLDIFLGRYAQADTRIKNATAMLEKTNAERFKKDLVHCLEASARLSIIQGDFLGANKQVIRAGKLLKRTEGDASGAGFDELTRLNIYFGKFNKTEATLIEAIALREKKFGKEHRILLSPLNQLAYLKIITGAFAEAEDLLGRSLSIARRTYGEKSVKLSETFLLQKQLYTFAGDYAKAQKAIEDAVEISIAKFGREHVRTGVLLHELALSRYMNSGFQAKNTIVVQSEDGGNDKTRGLKDKEKKKKEEKKKVVPKQNTELPHEPEPLIGLSITTIKNSLGDNNPMLAEALESAANYHLYNKQYNPALESIEAALRIWNTRLGESNLRSARLLVLKGGVLQSKGAYAEALKIMQQARSLFAKIFDENHPDYVAATGKCAQLQYISGNQKEAIELSLQTIDKSLVYIDKIFPGLSERGKTAYWEKVQHNFDFFKTIAVINAEAKPELLVKLMDLQIKTKAILLNSSIKVKKRILASGDSLLISTYLNWQANRENLATALSMSSEQRKEAGIEVEDLQNQIESLEKKLSASSELFAKSFEQKNYSTDALRKALVPGELLIEVIPFRYFEKKFTDTTWYAFLFLENGKSKINYTVIKDGHLLANRYLKYYRNCVRFEMNDDYSYKKYWEPIQEKIPAGTKTILFDSDGVYNQLNVETFKTPEGNYLLDKYTIALIGTARDILEVNSSKKTTDKNIVSAPYVLIGNPLYYSANFEKNKNVAQLEGAEAEVKAIAQELSAMNKTTQVMLLGEASEARVKELQYPEVFHISTHGFFMSDVDEPEDGMDQEVQNPLLRSGLLLKNGGQLLQQENMYAINKEDGVLTAYEAMNLNFDNTKLVVLSACETGLGEVKIGEGVYGLQRSFLVAGAQSIVMSLFKVNDEVTKALMLEFYKRWQSGESKRDAFANAKKEIMKKYPSPKFWGSFIMMGVN